MSGAATSLQQSLEQGLALHRQGDLQSAQAIYLKILEQSPQHYDAWQLLGSVAAQVQQWPKAQECYLRSLKIREDQPIVWFNLAKAYAALKVKDTAVAALNNAIKYDPTHIEAHVDRGILQRELVQLEAAQQDLEKALQLKPDHMMASRALALVLRDQGRHEEAIEMLNALSVKHPDNALLHTTLTSVLRDIGRVSEAQEHLKQALEIEPDDLETHYKLSVLSKKAEEHTDHIEQMKPLIDASGPDDKQVYLHFALAKAYDDSKDYDKAFEHYGLGNACMRRTLNYGTDRIEQYFNQIKAQFSPDFLQSHASSQPQHSDTTPIFILGMPRSGSTLTEQILSSHSQVEAAGEREELHNVIVGPEWKQPVNYVEKAKGWGTDDFLALGADYQERLKAVFGTPAYLVDKMPLNFRYIGMIALMLPHAKIIHTTRHPLDTCLSMYKRLFWGNHPYVYDQKELAEYYLLYQDLMAYWHEVLPGRIYDANYETLVNNPEEEIASLLEFCGLEWEDDCMNFHKTKRSVRTASAEQVRKPLYKDALAGWKRYEPYIQPMIDILGTESA